MLIKLPIDIWRDLFEWLFPNRKELAIKFNEFGDYQFSDICQKWLHEWTKSVCLENLRISPPPAKWTRIGGRLESANTESALLQCWGWGYQSDALPFAESELPENIVHFQEIHCRYLDTAVLQFFHRMQPLFMRKVNMEILTRGNRHTLRAARTTLDHLMPLLGGGIEDFRTDDSELIFTIRDRFPAQFFGIKRLLLFTVLYEDLYTVELLPKLLSLVCTRREDGQPWVLEMPAYCANATKLVKRIRQHFLKATGPASFFIRAQGPFRGIPESTTQNAITGEQLVTLAPRDNLLIIGRCLPLPALDGLTWAKEVEKKCRAAKKLHFPGLCRRKISIVFPKLGPIELEENEQEDGEDDDDVDQPGPSSKKPRLT